MPNTFNRVTLCLYIVGVFLCLTLLIVWFFSDVEEVRCDDVHIKIVNDHEDIDSNFFSEQIYEKCASIKGKFLNKINMVELEKNLSHLSFLSRVEVHISGRFVKVEVQIRKGIARLVDGKGQHFYCDKEGILFPVQGLFFRLPVVTGLKSHFASGEVIRKDLTEFLNFISKDLFFQHQIHQIHFLEPNYVELIPVVGYHHIILGELSGFRKKLKNLNNFYQLSIKRIDLNQYKTIFLCFKKQIVCSKNY